MESKAIFSGCGLGRSQQWAPAVLFMAAFAALLAGNAPELGAQSGGGTRRAADETALRVIQGRIMAIDGSRVTIKTPDGFPGGPGIHAQFVTAGPSIEADIAGSRILQPDGQRSDARPLTVGERILMVLRVPAEETAGGMEHAMIVERLALGDRIVSH